MNDIEHATPTESAETRPSPSRAFLFTAGLGTMLIPAAFLLAAGVSVDLLSLMRPGIRDLLIGLAATAPLIALLRWFMITGWRPFVRFRDSQLKFFSEIGFELTPRRNAILAVIAGVSEELMFRGVLQSATEILMPQIFAIALPAVLFGLLHARTVLYAVIAGGVGLYLGVMFWGTGSLVAPIITHTLYDYVALEWTRRAISDLKKSP